MDGKRREGGNVTTATAFEDLSMLFRDLKNESISHSCSSSFTMRIFNMVKRFKSSVEENVHRALSI